MVENPEKIKVETPNYSKSSAMKLFGNSFGLILIKLLPVYKPINSYNRIKDHNAGQKPKIGHPIDVYVNDITNYQINPTA